MGFPRTLYVAAKAATVAFTRALALELEGTGVTTTVVCPGLVDTEWNRGSNAADSRAMPPAMPRGHCGQRTAAANYCVSQASTTSSSSTTGSERSPSSSCTEITPSWRAATVPPRFSDSRFRWPDQWRSPGTADC
ncbi:SDR family NAD(P)-dependent oxidoreductase [Nocardia sp. CA-107356]|uniref:SDR family NAD(P)-dependent oxidoreductase n=1 Tax=Nocardia sp. CA-107356 TaxID=3239972 RepID=UPI003D89F537